MAWLSKRASHLFAGESTLGHSAVTNLTPVSSEPSRRQPWDRIVRTLANAAVTVLHRILIPPRPPNQGTPRFIWLNHSHFQVTISVEWVRAQETCRSGDDPMQTKLSCM